MWNCQIIYLSGGVVDSILKFVKSFVLSVMLMDWNGCPPFQWDWEHLFMLNPKSTENSKLQPTDWFGEVDRDINAGSFYLSWGGAGAGSGSDHVHSSKSSKSASINSSSIDESKTSILAFQGIQEDSSGKEDVSKNEPNETSRAIETSSSGEPLLSLKLGKRLYFEDVCPENDFKSTSISAIPISTSSTAKKRGSNIRSNQPPCCQVEGCNLDLSSAKVYHRKHRVCESHSKSSKVVVCGLERRFCQQCSRFHDLSEFDEKKRSCRKRLSDHNARRRKPHNEAVRFRSLCSTAYAAGYRQQEDSLANSSAIWQDTYRTHIQPKEFFGKSANGGPTSGNLQFSGTERDVKPKFSDRPFRMLPMKGTTAKTATDQGETVTATNSFHRALSLLSTNSWYQCETYGDGLVQTRQTPLSGIPLPAMQTSAHVSPIHSSERLLNDKYHIDSDTSIFNSESGRSRFQNFQLI